MCYHVFLQVRFTELQLSVSQQRADATALATPKLAENVWLPVAGHREDDAHALKICCTGVPDEVTTKVQFVNADVSSQYMYITENK